MRETLGRWSQGGGEEGRRGSAASFRFFPVERPLSRYASFLYATVVPHRFLKQVSGVRVPEIEAQLVFVIEQGDSFPGGRRLNGRWRASLFLQPPHLRAIPIPGTIREAVGASLTPAGLRLLVPRGRGEFSDSPLIPLQDLWGAPAHALLEALVAARDPEQRVALLRARLIELVLGAAPTNATVERALRLLNLDPGNLPVSVLARRCGVTGRALQTMFMNEVGLAPKHVARVIRLQRALRSLQRGGDSLRVISADSGFADQAHMSREFRDMMATTPDSLRRSLNSRAASPAPYITDRDLLSTGLLVLSGPP